VRRPPRADTGRCIAAFNELPLAQLKHEFAATTWQTPLSFAQWRKQLPRVKEERVAIDDGWYRKGMTLMSAPVCAPDGTARRFIGILGITAQLDAKRHAAIAHALRQSAATLEGALAASELS
jgi:DNA-binding IclR family transcriptional regulator